MTRRLRLLTATLMLGANSPLPQLASVAYADPSAVTALTLATKADLPGYTGDFDHFGVDLQGNRLFLAAEDHGTLEVFDLKTLGHLKTITGTETPHSILYMPDKNRLLVTDSGPGMTKLFDATSYALTGSIKLVPGADSVGYDAVRKRLYIVTGGKDVSMQTCIVSEIDPRTGKHYGDTKFDSNHVEAMAVELNGPYIFINVTDKNYLAVIDKASHKVVKTVHIKEAEQNAPIAMDEANHRLFIVTRKPGKLIVLNSDTFETLAVFKAPERTDEVVFDKENRRIYVPGGEGYIGVFQENDPGHYEELSRIASAPGAKTAILVPSVHRLFVAVSPGETKAMAGVLSFDVAANPAK